MSNDKLNDSLAVRPEFAAGEQPDHNKLSQAFIQVFGALNKVEGAIGPARDDSQTLYQNRLNHITNLTRQIGPAHGPQPRIPPGSTVVTTSPLRVERKEWLSPVWPFDTSGGPRIVFDGQFVDESGASVFATELDWLSPEVAMTATGQWIYDWRDNHIKSYSKLATAGGTAHFTSVIGIEAYAGYAALGIFGHSPPIHFGNANQNVIPHPLVSPSTSVVITESAVGSTGSYKVTLNPEVTTQDYHNVDFQYGDRSVSGMILGASSLTDEVGARPFFASTNLINQTLPSNFDTILSSDDLIPKNILMLYKDASTQAYPELQYYYRDQTSFYVGGQTLSTGSGYRVLVPGADVGQTLENNLFYMQHHRHRGPNSIVHKTISVKGYSTDGKGLADSSNVGWNRPQQRSVIDGNDHPQYFMRNGWSEGSDPENLDNAILGPMVFGYDTNGYADATNVAETSFPGAVNAPTHGIYFGESDFGGHIGIDTGYYGTSALVRQNFAGGFLEVDNTEGKAFLANGDTNSIRSLRNTQLLGADGDRHSFIDVAGSNILHVSLLGEHNKYDFRGYSLKTTIGNATSCTLRMQGSAATATMTDCLNGELKTFMAANNVNIDGASWFGAEIYNTSRNIDGAGAYAELGYNGFGKFKYISADKFVVDMEDKFVTKAIAPTDWFACDISGADGAMTLPGLYQDVGSIGVGGSSYIMATTPETSGLITFLHLPPDAHLYSFEPHLNHGGAIIDVLECSPYATGWENVLAQTLAATGNDLTSTDLYFTMSTGVRQGQRYSDYGVSTSYDVAIRIRNTAALGMTAAQCLYTYKLMRL